MSFGFKDPPTYVIVSHTYGCMCGEEFGVCSKKNKVTIKRNKDTDFFNANFFIKLTNHLGEDSETNEILELTFEQMNSIYKILNHPKFK